MERLIELALHAEDERVSSVCCVAVLDRAYGRPREAPAEDGPEDRFARMTRAERLAYVEALLAPMRKYFTSSMRTQLKPRRRRRRLTARSTD